MTDWALTPCEDCENVHLDTRKWSPDRWACVRFPRLPNLSPVAPKAGVGNPPYMRCVGINGGFCPLFQQRKGEDDE